MNPELPQNFMSTSLKALKVAKKKKKKNELLRYVYAYLPAL